jgi:2'-5' RNA ligase
MQVDGLRLHPAPPPRVRVFATSDLHVTLGFLGSVQESDARRAWDRIGEFPSFRTVTGLAGMITEARQTLLSAAGAPEDNRPPLPHMTLARIQRRAKAAERRQALRWADTIDLRDVTFTAPSVALYTWADDRQERLFQIVERHVFGS